MYDKRRYFAVAGLAACAVLAGCASKTEGTASFAGPNAPSSVPNLPSTLPSGTASSIPATPSASPSSSVESSEVPATSDAPPPEPGPTAKHSGSVDLEEDGVICDLISAKDLKKIWGQAPRVFPSSSGPGCTYKNADGDQIIINELDNLVPNEEVSSDLKYKDGAKKTTTSVGGRPAVILMQPGDFGDGYWYVSETKSLDNEGLITGLLSNDPHLQKIVKGMLEKIVPKYAR
ncbi:MAG TPA: hypothetical protein VHX59_12635 [Mycobacteriales bacterium]|jgi:hypothetical protein|nr:hypothetical protein [Mycobacteriales bacterium]